MKFKMPYLSLASFLERINNMERLTCVQKLVTESIPGDKNMLSVDMQLNIYFTDTSQNVQRSNP
jgi:hypothetical protein